MIHTVKCETKRRGEILQGESNKSMIQLKFEFIELYKEEAKEWKIYESIFYEKLSLKYNLINQIANSESDIEKKVLTDRLIETNIEIQNCQQKVEKERLIVFSSKKFYYSDNEEEAFREWLIKEHNFTEVNYEYSDLKYLENIDEETKQRILKVGD